ASRCPPDPASFSSARSGGARALHSFPTRRSSDLLVLALVLALLALVVSGWKLAAFSVVGFALIDSMELWKDSMDSLALVIVAAVVSTVLSVPIGIAAARNDMVSRLVRPILDFMQTMPAFVYLIPALSFCSIGSLPGVVATVDREGVV